MTIEIPLSKQGKHKGKYTTIISDEDADLAELRWAVIADVKRGFGGYVYRRTKETRSIVFLHRIILERIIGRPLEKGEEVDHINNNPTDNRRENLRIANRAQQNANQRLKKNNKSGYKGVCWDKARSKWAAEIKFDGKRYRLGRFDTIEDAYKAYCEAAIKYHGEFARFE